VQRLEEMRRLEEVRDPVEGVVVDQDRAQQRLLRLDIVRWSLLGLPNWADERRGHAGVGD
jgi:hypothetical protein